MSEKGPATNAISNARQLITSIRIFASDSGGSFPRDLRNLVSGGVLDREKLENLLNLPWNSKEQPMHWTYWPGLNDQSPRDHPLLTSPVLQDKQNFLVRWWKDDYRHELPTKPKRIVGTVDSTVTYMDEADFQKMLIQQKLVLPSPDSQP